MSNRFQFFKDLSLFIGKKALFWLFLSFLFAIFLSVIELLISLFIQLFLVNLNVISVPVQFMGISIPKLEISTILIILLTIGFFRFICQFITTHSTSFALEFTKSRLKSLAIYDLIYRPTSENGGISEVNFRISEIFPKSADFISNIVYFSTFLLQCSILIIIMFFIAWKESIIGIIGIFIIGMIVVIINNRLRKISYHIPIEQQQLNAGIEKISKNLIFIKIMKTDLLEHKKLLENNINYCLKSVRTSFLNILASTCTPFFGIILIVLVITFSQVFWHTPALILISFLYLLIRFVQNLSSLSGYFGVLNTNYSRTLTALQYFKSFKENERQFAINPTNVVNYLGSKKTYIIENNYFNTDQNQSTETRNPTLFSGTPKIDFSEVFYRYKNSNITSINNISFTINPGVHFGIVGASGSGKSTLLLLLLGLLEPTCGKISIADMNPYDFFSKTNIKISYVGPEAYLIKGTLRENLIYGIKEFIDDEKILQALELASMKTFMESHTLDYFIQEDQQGLSSGQKQRLCIARAFLNNPQLLILDEATSNLDETTESSIADSVEKFRGKCTAIIVTHRPKMLKYVDTILNLDQTG